MVLGKLIDKYEYAPTCTHELVRIPFHNILPQKNVGQNGGKAKLDLNVEAAWAQGFTGKNVTTAIMDDGNYFFPFARPPHLY